MDAAASAFAAVLGVERDAVRVRLQHATCTVCNLEQNRADTSLAGLSLAEAAERVQEGDHVYLFVPRFACIYTYAGKQLALQECRYIPL